MRRLFSQRSSVKLCSRRENRENHVAFSPFVHSQYLHEVEICVNRHCFVQNTKLENVRFVTLGIIITSISFFFLCIIVVWVTLTITP